MEVTIASCRGSAFSIVELKEGRLEVKKNVKFSKTLTKETLTVSMSKQVRITRKPNLEEKEACLSKT